MPTLLTTGLLAFGLCLAFTPLLRALLRRLPQWRRPDQRGDALVAAEPGIPRLGGLAVLAATAAALGIQRWMGWGIAGQADSALLLELAAPVLLVLLLGAADDCWNLRPTWKLLGQFAAALWVAAKGIRVDAVFHHPLPLLLSLVITVVWLVGCSNAFNLIDGLDGLATGLALFATGTVLAHAVLIGEPGLALIMGVLSGALAGFLLFNFPPATIYLGDAGSLSIGFLLGCMALAWANKATTMVGLSAPLFAVMVPVLDTISSLVRRGLARKPLFGGDQGHIHHRLLRRGWSVRGALLVLYGAAGLGAVASLLLADLQQRHTFELVILLMVALGGLGAQQLGYVQFYDADHALRRRGLPTRDAVRMRAELRRASQAISQSRDFAEAWAGVVAAADALGFTGVELRAGAAGLTAWNRRETAAGTPVEAGFRGWTCHLPLGQTGDLGQLIFWSEDAPLDAALTTVMVSSLEPALAARLAALAAPGAAARSAVAGVS